MNRSLLEASWLAVHRPPVLAPLGIAVLVVVATIPWQDGAAGGHVLHGVAVLAACALAGATDDPAAEVVAASPYPRRVRTTARLAVAGSLTAAVVVLAVVVAELRNEFTPLLLLVAEIVGFAVAGVLVGAVLRGYGVAMPAYPAVVGVLLLAVLVRQLPRSWVLVDAQPWGPPWEATLLRWSAVVLFAVAVVALALRDPWEQGPWRRTPVAGGADSPPVPARGVRPQGLTAPGRGR